MTLKAEVDALSTAPLNRAVVVRTVAEQGERAAMLEVSAYGRLLLVAALPEVSARAGTGS